MIEDPASLNRIELLNVNILYQRIFRKSRSSRNRYAPYAYSSSHHRFFEKISFGKPHIEIGTLDRMSGTTHFFVAP